MLKSCKILSKGLKYLNVYLKVNLGSNGFLLLQETHSSLIDEKKSADELKGPIFFSHDKTYPCGVGVGYTGRIKSTS